MDKSVFGRTKRAVFSTILIGAMGLGLFGGAMPAGDGYSSSGVVWAASSEEQELSQYIEYPEVKQEDSGSAAVDSTSEFTVSENWLQPAEIHGSETVEPSSLMRRGASFSAKYDPRDIGGMISGIRDQGDNDTCWAFSLIAAMESNLIKKGYADASIDLSENQFAYFFYNRQNDKLGFTSGDYNSGRRSWNTNGGTLVGAGLAITTWAGATTESRSPYVSTPDKSLCYAHEYSAANVIFYNYNIKSLSASVNRIKQAVMDYGAVATGINIDADGCDVESGACYYNEEAGNHAVTIVGWDDNYSKDNFKVLKSGKKKRPDNDGAWIAKNSWGVGFGDNGYIYISYEDASLAEMLSVDTVPISEQYDSNYQHDGTANPTMSVGLPNGSSYANVFKAKSSSDYVEELKAVGICTYSTNVRYEVQIYTGLSSTSKPTSGKKAFSSAVTGVLANAGYQTIELPKAVGLVPGENFSIVVKLANSTGAPYIALDTSGMGQDAQGLPWISFTAKVSKGQSFVYYKKKWMDLKNLTDRNGRSMPSNLRIKAYTDLTQTKASFKLSDSSTGVSKGGKISLSLKMTPANIYRSVTWKSSNKKVATVSSTGKVTGKSYGTATISASFMKGGKKKTLKCKLTVGPSKPQKFGVSAGTGQITVKWKKSSGAKGYEVWYAASKDGKYTKLAAVKGGKSKVTKKLNSGTYYVKMRAYRLSGKKKLYGSYTTAKQVTVQ